MKQPISVAVLLLFLSFAGGAYSQNDIITENSLTGTPSSVWDISGAGDLNIQGFATDISVNKGGTVHFKIDVKDGSSYSIKIYRLGYYQGNGACLKADLGSFSGVMQPAPLFDAATGLIDCGNWSESASWAVPSDAVSGLYFARLQSAGGGASHIFFVVRNDGVYSDVLFKTSDATWQAYNVYGGYSLYVGAISSSINHAAKVSYNRPFITRNGGGGGGVAEDWLFNAEYPMIRWLERNGYDISYTTDVDMDRDATSLTPSSHRILLSVGHDEYWSPAKRTRFEDARAAGVNLAFFSGNEVYWKTRWEASMDGSATPYRTLVCYKEGTEGENTCGGKCDPLPNTWTGLWRSGCADSLDACKPENALTGQISWAESTGSIEVPGKYANYRFWRNTSIAAMDSTQTASLSYGTLGYEWDPVQPAYASHDPAGLIILSNTTLNGQTHRLSMYRYPGGGWVFGAGTVQWSWGLDGHHDRGSSVEDANLQQATVNLFADMGAQPGSLQAGLTAASASSDVTAPATVISYPVQGDTLSSGSELMLSGTSSDDHLVAGVEVSTDGGLTWQRATGTTQWTYGWTPPAVGNYTIKVRGFDDSGNMETAGNNPAANVITITISDSAAWKCPCNVLGSQAPADALQNDGTGGMELGMKFRAAVNGHVTGVRFYKTAGNSGTHTGELYSSSGVRLAQAVFVSETASGWQEVSFSQPVAITAGTTYLVAYHSSNGYYTATDGFFVNPVLNNPLTGLADGTDGYNGVYAVSSSPVFPTSHYLQSNYWVDVIFDDAPNTWKGTVSSAWENGANWSWGTVPTAGSDVIIGPGNPYPAVLSSSVTIHSLTLQPGAGLQVLTGYQLTVSGQ